MALAHDDGAHWLAAARNGSREALGQALDAFRGYLLLIAQQELDAGLQAKGGASDLVQETFLEAQKDFEQFHGQTQEELKAWLRQLLLNNVANFARRYRATAKRYIGREVPLAADSQTAGQEPLAGAAPSPADLAIAREQAAIVRARLTRLPEDYQRALVLRYQEGRTFEEIGRALGGRTPNAARMLWLRAIERLQQELELES